VPAMNPDSPGSSGQDATMLLEEGRSPSCVVVRIFWKLVQFEGDLRRGDFASLYTKVRRCPVAQRPRLPRAAEKICGAFDMACIWYWKPVLCLQRSAVITCVLRQHGVPAQMVIGTHNFPFKAHAWVEVAGQVVSDKPYMREIYSVLDVC
jgi:hypothetical protein